MCDPDRCDRDVTDPVTSPIGPKLGIRGRRLWRDLTEKASPGPAQLVLIEEACRIADRLDQLDAHLRGDEGAWLRFHSLNEDGSIVQVVVDKALAEARQQAVALKQIAAELRQSTAAPVKSGEGSLLDELAAARARRLADASGQ